MNSSLWKIREHNQRTISIKSEIDYGLVPLRIYIGCLWALEGLKKLIGENTWTECFSSIVNGNWSG